MNFPPAYLPVRDRADNTPNRAALLARFNVLWVRLHPITLALTAPDPISSLRSLSGATLTVSSTRDPAGDTLPPVTRSRRMPTGR